MILDGEYGAAKGFCTKDDQGPDDEEELGGKNLAIDHIRYRSPPSS